MKYVSASRSLRMIREEFNGGRTGPIAAIRAHRILTGLDLRDAVADMARIIRRRRREARRELDRRIQASLRRQSEFYRRWEERHRGS